MNKNAILSILIGFQVLNLCFSWPVAVEKTVDKSMQKEITVLDCSTLVGIAVNNTVFSLRSLCELSGLLPESSPKPEEEKKYPKKHVYPINISHPYRVNLTYKTFSDISAKNLFLSSAIVNYNPLHINIFLKWLYLLGIYLCFHRLKLSYLKIKDIIDHTKVNNAIGMSKNPGFVKKSGFFISSPFLRERIKVRVF